MDKKITILALAGSLRKKSYNRGLLNAAVELAPKNCVIEIFDLGGIPLYNQDEENTLPKRVAELKQKVRSCHIVLIATPEYNYSVPGVLKNAIDWVTRPSGDNAWAHKRVAIMGASLSIQGTSRAQSHLRQILHAVNAEVFSRPEVMIGSAQDKFDENGVLTDVKAKESVQKLLQTLCER